MAKVYIRFMDKGEESASIKLVADPPQSEWDTKNLTPAQILAMLAMGAAMDAGEASADVDPEPTEAAVKGSN